MKKRFFLFTVSITFLQYLLLPAFAVKAFPYPVSIKQPDGTLLNVVLNGDEFHHYKTTEDGFLIKKNLKGIYQYAKLDANKRIIESNIPAKNASDRTLNDYRLLKSINSQEIINNIQSERKKSKMFVSTELPEKVFPLNGTPKSLVILVNFQDTAFVTPSAQTAFSNLLNQDGYNSNGGTGSARDYFMASSFGKFAPNFDIVGPFNLPNPMSYYGANDASGNDLRPVEMIVDACTAANATVDFTQYDTDNDGKIDNVFVYYAGYNEAEWGPDNSIWPHRWQVIKNYNYFGSTTSITFDGKKVYNYACSSELKGSSGTNMCGIGTFCHEFGHVLGLVDLYNTDDQSKPTLGSWSIMSSGNYLNGSNTPPTYSAWDRFYLGWFTPQEAKQASNLTLQPLYQGKTVPQNTINQCFLLSDTTHNLIGDNPTPSEFFLLEYRKKVGWDSYLPAEGMCVWHIDYDANIWATNTPNNYTGTTQTSSSHMHVYLVPPTGVGTTPPTTAFTTGNYTPLNWAGEDIQRPITSIIKTTDSISFKLLGGVPSGVANTPLIKAGVIDTQLIYGTIHINTIKTKILNIKTTDAQSNLVLEITGLNANLFSASTSSITSLDSNSNEGFNITITYSPLSTGNHSATLTISGGGLNPAKVINMTGEGI